ncbi:MAG: tRNA pseudouridine(13) synthase TruD [Gammaproteobacteria bacterium]|nr:tRNA pseudouridine(13) synthase TruD [Gammaproteobacteria bacterium]MBT8055557.1 tRNA pseudouridine(13) synthase TruD [Gammaproteobacteria bacterium]
MTVPSGLPDWARCLGPPDVSGRLRCRLEDFQVFEKPLITPDGAGNHLWLEIEKRGANTDWVAGQLAAAAGVPRRDVGFAGMKDRHGVTTQWFSIGLQEADNADWENWSIEGVRFLHASRHGRKLRRGVLAGNRFRLVVRELTGNTGGLAERIAVLAANGIPNYFGPQRFGHGGRNVDRARAWLEKGGRVRRQQRSLYLSAARSFLFNHVLSTRVQRGDWNRLLDGEMAQLDGRRPVFSCDLPDVELERRCDLFEIHPTGPMPGRVGRGPERDAAEVENAVLNAERDLIDALARAGADAARRSLRAIPRGLKGVVDDDTLELVFELPPGSYATSLLREIIDTRDTASREP